MAGMGISRNQPRSCSGF